MTQAIQQSSTHKAVRRYLDGLNALDPGLAVSAYAPNAVVRYPRPVAPMGVDAFRAYLEQVKLALAGLNIAPRELFETEHGVAFAQTRSVADPVMRTADRQRHEKDLAATDFQAGHAHDGSNFLLGARTLS